MAKQKQDAVEEEDMSFEEVVREANFSIQEVEEEVENVDTITEAVPEAASTSKVIDIEPDIPLGGEPVTSGFRLVDMEILGSVINCLAYPECFGSSSLQLHDINEKKKGLARLLEISCTTCPYKQEFYTSKQVKKHLEEDQKEEGGGKHMEINLRAVYGMRSIGVGHASLGKMCCHLNMPEPMNSKNYDKLSNTLRDAVKVVAERSVVDVFEELRGENETADASVSVDGTWQRKRFTSTLGVVTAISVDKGKVVDCVIHSKFCKGFTRMEKVRMLDPDRRHTMESKPSM